MSEGGSSVALDRGIREILLLLFPDLRKVNLVLDLLEVMILDPRFWVALIH